ncbi:MAG: hypothetical protein JSU72_15780 [Deltaproteobacteria bacterium]|nr:MAG: hypothetical protein JSU72_15780 [Deltaproteobacteria bacterium]
MDRNLRGDFVEVFVIMRLMEQGLRVAIPYGQTKGLDLLVENKHKKWRRIQVKSAQKKPDGRYRVHLVQGNPSSGRRRYINKEFDYLIAAAPDDDKFWIFPFSFIKGKSCLSVSPRREEGWKLLEK